MLMVLTRSTNRTTDTGLQMQHATPSLQIRATSRRNRIIALRSTGHPSLHLTALWVLLP